VVAKLLRLCGHGEHDDASYVDPKLKQSPIGRDCLVVAEQIISKENWAFPPNFKKWKEEAAHQVEEAVAQVQREPAPDPFREDWRVLASKNFAEGYDQVA
jgi:pyruvate dehydrogenase E1 component alpha subunit/2-oxoisovalerate dehydrogenase E1 component alpha subunit